MLNLVWQLAVPVVVGLIGVAVGWGMSKNQVKVNERSIEKLWENWDEIRAGGGGGQSLYIARSECEKTMNKLKKDLCEVKEAVETQSVSMTHLQNYARWALQKEGLDLSEVNKILNGEG